MNDNDNHDEAKIPVLYLINLVLVQFH